MTPAQALAFVERHGIVLESSRRGTIPSLADAIAGETLSGSWWAHAHGKRIFAATRALRDAAEVLVCRLVDGRITFVHERCWPALARLVAELPASGLARVRDVHTSGGRHRSEEIPFEDWLPAHARAAAEHLTDADARATLAMLPFLQQARS